MSEPEHTIYKLQLEITVTDITDLASLIWFARFINAKLVGLVQTTRELEARYPAKPINDEQDLP